MFRWLRMGVLDRAEDGSGGGSGGSAPDAAAPDAGVPDDGGKPDEPAGEEARKGFDFEAARRAIAEGRSPFAEEDEEEPEEPEGEPGDEGPEAEEGEEEPPDPDAEVEEEEEGKAPDPEEEPEEEGVDELVSARLPGRGPDDEDEEWEVPPPLAESINRLRNGYMRGEEARRQQEAVSRRAEELQETIEEQAFIDRELETDPAGFLLERVKPEIRTSVLLSLLSDDKVWEDEGFQEELDKLSRDPDRRELVRTRTENERIRRKDQLTREMSQARDTREQIRETASNLLKLIPEDMDPERAKAAYTVSMRRLGEEAYRRGRGRFTTEEIATVLEQDGILAGYGLEAPRPGSDGSNGEPSGDRGTPPARKDSRRKAGGSRRATVEEARTTGSRLKESSRRRKEAAAVSPAGGGAPPASTELKRVTSVQERIKDVRKRGLRRLLGD